MKKEEVMDYVMNTPGNTNPNVLGPMLGALEGDKLPNITPADAGKVLAVNNSGVWVASERFVILHAEANAEGSISAGNGNPTFGEISRHAVNGGNFACMFSFNSRTFVAALYVAQVSAYQIDFVGEIIYYDAEMRYSIKMYASTEDESLILGGRITPLDRFIVTLTPTAADYSGTMDKTVAEIDAAYKAGQKIVFSLNTGTETYEIPMAYRCADDVSAYFTVYVIDAINNIMINAYTTDVQESTTYSTKIYTLTPAT